MNTLSKRIIISALVFPIAILLGLVCYLQYQRQHYPTYIVPIVAYDPRTFLAGNYLAVTLADDNYNTQFNCKGVKGEGYSCWQQQGNAWQVVISKDKPTAACQIIDAGYCYQHKFISNTVLRFFIPENMASSLEAAVLKNRGSMKVMVLPNGIVRPLNLYIDGQPWDTKVK